MIVYLVLRHTMDNGDIIEDICKHEPAANRRLEEVKQQKYKYVTTGFSIEDYELNEDLE